jgi:NADH-quinone oxidoreductase subunit N
VDPNTLIGMLLAILPHLLTLTLAGAVMVVDVVVSEDARKYLGWVTAGGLGVILVLALLFSRPGETGALVWGGALRADWMAFTFEMMFLFGAMITAIFAMDSDGLSRRGEFFVLLLVATVGMMLMAGAADLIMLFLAIETVSIPLYVLAGFLTQDKKSTEAGYKYLLFGGVTSAIMLYGFSLIYGLTSSTQMYEIGQLMAQMLSSGSSAVIPIAAAMLLVMIGFMFKISAAPFHFWAPDVYEGAPTPVAGFLSTASKAAGFAVLIRMLSVVFPALFQQWTILVAVIAVLTMTIGNLIALTQKNVKRLLAYSSIAHAGYVLVGVAAISQKGILGLEAAVFYLIAYILTNLAAFGIVTAVGRTIGSDEIADYAGLSRRSPGLALGMLVAFLSLSGMPPFAGFIGKVLLFAAAVQSNLVWLAVIGVLNSIIGLYYYLTLLKVVYLYQPPEGAAPVQVSRSFALGLGVLVLGIILVGTLFAPWYSWSSTAVMSMFQ